VSTRSELTLWFSSVFGNYVAHMLDFVLLKNYVAVKIVISSQWIFWRPENCFIKQ